ncbi:MAG: orotidine-5'-phosphate decarboxylase [Tissierellia bacterium]|nr:orotidine-5'-phosphate decarboxylase [Tissierellia bacterium]
MSVDRLFAEVAKKGPICVGLDPHMDHMPEEVRGLSIEETIFTFNKKIIDATKDLVAVYKPQAAYYEAYGLEGVRAYQRTLEHLRKEGALIINDVKRGDISSTAGMYAKAYFEGDMEGDLMTLNPYMGMDSIEPYMEYVEKHDKGLFVIVKTSNPGSRDIECLEVDGEPLYIHVGRALEKLHGNTIGKSGYRNIGFVIGATNTVEGEGAFIRKAFPDTFFLVPGYGAQGGKGADALTLLQDGNGGVVNSSRGIIRAFEKSSKPFDEAARDAVLSMKEDLRVGL